MTATCSVIVCATFHEQSSTEQPGCCPPLPSGGSGMDLSGLSDPFCVVFWNDREVGRTAVRYGTRDPDWASDDDSSGQIHPWFQLPFFVPEADKWGEQAWPPMCLEVSPLKLRESKKHGLYQNAGQRCVFAVRTFTLCNNVLAG